jgi:tRNA nucleotidyltransferase (CCA-adding enzyme)
LRFSEDALRILRAIRFSSQLGFSIESSTAFRIHYAQKDLLRVSKERIAVELNKLVLGDNAYTVLMQYSDVISTIVPEVTPCINFDQHSRYHKYDVWEHMAISVKNSPKILPVRLAMLFHDIAKPIAFTLDENGNGHFCNHAHIGAGIVEKILKYLKYDNATIKRVSTLVYHHDDDFYTEYDIKKTLSNIGEEAFLQLLEVQSADSKSKHEFCRDRLTHIEHVRQQVEGILTRGDCITLKALAVNGDDVKSQGVEGKAIGERLEYLLDEVMRGKLPNDRETLLKRI